MSCKNLNTWEKEHPQPLKEDFINRTAVDIVFPGVFRDVTVNLKSIEVSAGNYSAKVEYVVPGEKPEPEKPEPEDKQP